MEPLTIDRTHILVLNYNGRALLEECLPSIVEAAGRSPVPCRCHGGRQQLDRRIAGAGGEPLSVGRVHVRAESGAGLVQPVLERLRRTGRPAAQQRCQARPGCGRAAACGVFESHDDVFFSAPCCWTFDGRTYEGMRTRVRSRFGLVQGMCRVPGFEEVIDREDLTAAAGPVLAVDRRRFLELGGYDPIYFPGRIEDLDLGFRVWMAGYRGYYVPESVAFHKGFGTFEPQLGKGRCDLLASRNTLIFMWKNTGGARLLRHFLWLPIRLGGSLLLRAARVCAGVLGGPRARATGARRLAARWRWGRGDGSSGKRRSSGVSSGKSGVRTETGPGTGGLEQAGRRLMSARAFHLVIDARPRGRAGLLAAEVVLGKSVLDHLLELADRARAARVSRWSSTRARTSTRGCASWPAARCAAACSFVCGPPRADAAVLRTDRFYDAGRLRRGLCARGGRRNRRCSGGSTGRRRWRSPRKS